MYVSTYVEHIYLLILKIWRQETLCKTCKTGQLVIIYMQETQREYLNYTTFSKIVNNNVKYNMATFV